MAEALFKNMVGGIYIDSTGTQPAKFISHNAQRLLEDENAVKNLKGMPEGIDTKKLENYDIIVAMEDLHRLELLKRNAKLENRILVWNIEDPMCLLQGHGRKVLEELKRRIFRFASL